MTEADQVLIEGLAVRCVIGVHAWERRSRQSLLISAALHTDFTDLREATVADHDKLQHAIDYSAVARDITRHAQAGAFELLETLAESLAATLLEAYPIRAVTLTVRKPAAIRDARAAGVRITRAR